MLVPRRDHVVLGGSAQPEPVRHSLGDSLSHSLGDSISHPIAESVGQPESHFVSYLVALGNGKHLGKPQGSHRPPRSDGHVPAGPGVPLASARRLSTRLHYG